MTRLFAALILSVAVCLLAAPGLALAASQPGAEHEKLKKLQQRAEAGDAAAASALGSALFTAAETPEQQAKAAIWLEKAAQAGVEDAQWYMATLALQGIAIPEDKTKAIFWYETIAENPAASLTSRNAAAVHAGHLWKHGAGEQADVAKATLWFETAANRGYHPAQFALGELYAEAGSDPENRAKALFWLRKAAQNGFTRAYYTLGAVYLGGPGEKGRNAVQSWFWFSLAQESAGTQYEGTIPEELESLEKSMSPKEKEEARRALAAWQKNAVLPPVPKD